MKLFTLDKKLITVNHRMTKQEIVNVAEAHKVDVKAIEEEVKRQIFVKFLPVIAKNFRLTALNEDDYITYSVSGYILTERQLYEVMLEVLELDDWGKEKLVSGIKKHLGMFTNADNNHEEIQ